MHFMVWKSDTGDGSKRWAVVREPASTVCCRYGETGCSHSSDLQFGTESWWHQNLPIHKEQTSNLRRGSVRKKTHTQMYIHTCMSVFHPFYLTWKLQSEVVELLLMHIKHHNKPCGRLCGWKLEPWCKTMGKWWVGKGENSWKMLL